MNASHHSSEFIPAHRVVNRNGLLTGKHHFDTPNVMRELLENEGLLFDDSDQIINFQERFWDPTKELEM
jgi:methylated-DNA-protein-cysteine methyltransferase-like protein